MKFYLLLIILFSSLGSAQDLTFIYEVRFKTDPIKAEFKTELYFLDIKDNRSMFRSERNRKSDSLKAATRFGYGSKINFNNQFDVVKDYGKNTVFKVIISPLYKDLFLLKPDVLEWKITGERLKISEYECQKAEVNYGGRNWNAWFTTTIPISDGPYVFGQLPGLIVKVADEANEFSFDLIKVQKNDWSELHEPKNATEINWEKFKNLQETYYQQPFSVVRSQNLPIGKSDSNGNSVRLKADEMREMEENVRKGIRENYNPIELNYKLEYE